jgi:hypothetical protein
MLPQRAPEAGVVRSCQSTQTEDPVLAWLDNCVAATGDQKATAKLLKRRPPVGLEGAYMSMLAALPVMDIRELDPRRLSATAVTMFVKTFLQRG